MRVAQAHRKTHRGRSMAEQKKPARVRLKELRERAGLSLRSVGKSLRYASAAGYHRYEREKLQGDDPIPIDIVRRLIPLFRGQGQPAITVDEIMALTNVSGFPRSAQAAFSEQASDDGLGRLLVRYRIEDGVYIKFGAKTGYGAARIGPSPDYPTDAQFVAVCSNHGCGDWYRPKSQLHCVDPEQVSRAALTRARVLVAVAYEKSDLAELRLARVEKGQTMYGHDDEPIEGKVIGVVVGAYIPESL